MSTLSRAVDDVAKAFFGALEAGSVEEVTACFTPDAQIWHNFDGKTLTPQENRAGVEALFQNFAKREYRDVRRQPTPAGFVQEHVLHLEAVNGTVIDWPACVVVDVAHGKITRVAEYIDLSKMTPAH